MTKARTKTRQAKTSTPRSHVTGLLGAAGGYTDGSLVATDDHRRFWGVPTLLKAQIARLVDKPTIGLFGIPFDGGNSRTPGTRFGPRGLRNASFRISGYNADFDISPHVDHRLADYGDVVLSPFSIEDAYKSIQGATARIIADGALPIAVGGDHSVTLPVMRAVCTKHGPLAVIHFDAHCDVSDSAFGKKYHYGSVFRRAVEEGLVKPGRFLQVGIRKFYHSGELEFVKRNKFEVITAKDLKRLGPNLRTSLERRFRRLRGNKIYVTFDIDFVDYAYAPGIGSPEPFGPSSFEAIECVKALNVVGKDIVGFDIVEVAPPLDVRDQTSYLAAQILFEMVSVVPPTVRSSR